MNKMICILLMLCAFVLPAAAEESPLAPFEIAAPAQVALEENEGTFTYVYGMTRVVAMVIDRVPDADPAEAVQRMMGQFDPDAVLDGELPVRPGFAGLAAFSVDKYGAGVDALTVMILSETGELLILSGYDLNGEEAQVQQLLDALLANLSVDGSAVVTAQE